MKYVTFYLHNKYSATRTGHRAGGPPHAGFATTKKLLRHTGRGGSNRGQISAARLTKKVNFRSKLCPHCHLRARHRSKARGECGHGCGSGRGLGSWCGRARRRGWGYGCDRGYGCKRGCGRGRRGGVGVGIVSCTRVCGILRA